MSVAEAARYGLPADHNIADSLGDKVIRCLNVLVEKRVVTSGEVRASDHLAEQRPELQQRFAPAMLGLKRAIDGLEVETPPNTDGTGGAKRFLGWTTGKHWLLS